MAILTPAQLWENYDRFKPAEPTYLQDGEHSLRVYFNGERIENQATRIFARLSLPDSIKKPPVIIFLNAAQKSADETDVSPLTKMGYAVLSVDYAAVCPSGHCTRYPRAILSECTIESAVAPPQNPRTSAWYHWTAVALHAVTFLEECPHVDNKKIGIFGIDEGASIVFKASNLVKLCAGMTFFCGETKSGFDDNLDYLASLDSRAYGKNLFPLLINTTSNEKSGALDYLNELCPALSDAYFCVMPRADKSVGSFQRDNIKIWFDYYFDDSAHKQPIEKPSINLALSEGNLYAELSYCNAQRVNFYAASDGDAYLRNWNEISFSRLGQNKYLAKIDVFSPKTVLAFANVLTQQGLMLSTSVLAKQPQKLAEAKKSRLLYNSDMGVDVFMTENGSFFEDKTVELREGPLGLSGVFGNHLTTFKTGESRFCAEPDNLLQIILYAQWAQDVEFKLVLKDCMAEEFSCHRRLAGGEWSTITLSKNDFKSIMGCPSFDKAVCLSIFGESIIVNSILWV